MYFNVMERQEHTTCLVSATSSYCVSLVSWIQMPGKQTYIDCLTSNKDLERFPNSLL